VGGGDPDVGRGPAGLPDGVLAVPGLTDNLDVRLEVEDLAQPHADQRLVVGDEDAGVSSGRQQPAQHEAAVGRLSQELRSSRSGARRNRMEAR
jgi:hypothetical protein